MPKTKSIMNILQDTLTSCLASLEHCKNSLKKKTNSLSAHSEQEREKMVAATLFQWVALRGRRGEAQSTARTKPVLNR